MSEAFLEDDSHGYSATTLAITRQWTEHLQDFLGPTPLEKASAEQLAEWHRGLLWRPGPSGRNYSQNTVNQAVGSVRRFFRWAREQGLVPRNPSLSLRSKRGDTHKRLLTPPEARQLLEATERGNLTSTRDRALLGLWTETGIPLAFQYSAVETKSSSSFPPMAGIASINSNWKTFRAAETAMARSLHVWCGADQRSRIRSGLFARCL